MGSSHAVDPKSSSRSPSFDGWHLIQNLLIDLSSRSHLAKRMTTAGLRDLDAMIPTGMGNARHSPRSPRLRQRANRRKLATFFTAVSMIALSWCRVGGITEHVPRSLPDRPWIKSDLFRRWTAACRADPFSFRDDKRGRMRDFVSAVTCEYTESEPFDPLSPLSFVQPVRAAPKRESLYEGPGASAASLVQPFDASRLSMPKRAAVVPLDDWLHESTRLLWNAPELETPPSEPVRGYFPVTMAQWRASLRKMVRAGLATTLPSNTRDPSLAAGAFTVRKDVDRDRLIADRRPENARERQVGLCLLPYGPRLRRVQLRGGQYMRCSVQDLHNMYYVFKVSPERLARQIIGPRVPLSWFAHLDDESLDTADLGPELEHWHWSDVRPKSRSGTPWKPGPGELPGMAQVALTAALMGDLNAVTVCQQAHRRMLLASGGLHPDELLLPGKSFPCGALFGDAYVDDLAVFMILHFSARGIQEDEKRLQRIFAMYENVGFARNDKGVLMEADRVDVWGAEVRGFKGTVAYGLQKRATLCMATLLSCSLGVSGKQLSQLVGTWSYACAYRREVLAVLDTAFLAVRKLPLHRKVLPSGALLDELVALVGLMPLMESDLRARPHLRLYASDASESGLGACSAPISESCWQSLFKLAEERGCHVRLDWQSTDVAKLVDNRSAACGIALQAKWGACLQVEVTRARHINLLELEALYRLLEKIARSGVRRARLLVLVDSQVTLGAVTKGRSSSRRVNFWLRRVAGVCLSYGLSVDLVWVPTKANPADAPSRFVNISDWITETQEALGQPGSLPPVLPCASVTTEAAHELSLLGPPYPAARPDAAERRDHPPEPASSCGSDYHPVPGHVHPLPDGAVQPYSGGHREGAGDPAALAATSRSSTASPCVGGVPCPHQSTGNELDVPDEQSLPPGSQSPPPRVPVRPQSAHRPTLKVPFYQPDLLPGRPAIVSDLSPVASGRALRRVSSAPREAWEIFAGKGALSLWLERAGLKVLPGVDTVEGPWHWDLSSESVLKRVFQHIRQHGIRYVHLGTPCSSFSMALRGAARTRSKANPLGDPSWGRDRTANTLVRNSVRIIRYMERLGGYWSLENPLSSLIWCFPGLAELRSSRHFVRFDQCAYGAAIPGEGPCRKSTAVLTNFPALWGLRSRCRCHVGHVQLKGSFKLHGRWTSRTRFAGRYPPSLARHWSSLAAMGLASDMTPKRTLAYANWVRLFLLMSGDIESNPGPRPSVPGAHILDVGDVAAQTARTYARAFSELNEFVSVLEPGGMAGILEREGGPGVTKWVGRFLRAKFDTKRRAKVGQASHVVSAVRRWLLLTAVSGVVVPDVVTTLRPLRRMLRVWQLITPTAFRRPVWREAALALATLAVLEHRPRLAALVLMQFHGLLRPGEARQVRWVDLGFLHPRSHELYPDTFGVIGIVRPKTRRMSVHSVHQYVTVESSVLAVFLRRLLAQVPSESLEEPIWPGSHHFLRLWWLRSVQRLGLLEFNLTWAGLRAGGATDHWLQNKNLPALRRRGRWSNELTLERYVQEAIFVQCTLKLPPRVDTTLRRLAELSGQLLSSLPESCLVLEEVEARPRPDSSSDEDSE